MLLKVLGLKREREFWRMLFKLSYSESFGASQGFKIDTVVEVKIKVKARNLGVNRCGKNVLQWMKSLILSFLDNACIPLFSTNRGKHEQIVIGGF